MDIYKQKFTKLQNSIFRLLCIKAGDKLNQRRISKILKVSPTAVSKSLSLLEKERLITIERHEMNLNFIQFNRENHKAIQLKRVENLKILYEIDLVDVLEETFPGCTIILFGSFSRGEDTIRSDVDIAVIDSKNKEIDLEEYEKSLERKINVQIYKSLKEINNELKSNILSGITLVGVAGI